MPMTAHRCALVRRRPLLPQPARRSRHSPRPISPWPQPVRWWLWIIRAKRHRSRLRRRRPKRMSHQTPHSSPISSLHWSKARQSPRLSSCSRCCWPQSPAACCGSRKPASPGGVRPANRHRHGWGCAGRLRLKYTSWRKNRVLYLCRERHKAVPIGRSPISSERTGPMGFVPGYGPAGHRNGTRPFPTHGRPVRIPLPTRYFPTVSTQKDFRS